MYSQSLDDIKDIYLDIQLSLRIFPQPVLSLVFSSATAEPLGAEAA